MYLEVTEGVLLSLASKLFTGQAETKTAPIVPYFQPSNASEQLGAFEALHKSVSQTIPLSTHQHPWGMPRRSVAKSPITPGTSPK